MRGLRPAGAQPPPGSRSRSPAPLSPLQDQALPRSRPRARTQGPGRKRKASCEFLFFFFQPSQPKQKKGHLKRPRDPLRSPATHLRAVPGGGGAAAFTRAASPQHPSPHVRVQAAAAAAGAPGSRPLPPARPEEQPRACSEHVPAVVPARLPLPEAGPASRWRSGAVAGRSRYRRVRGNPKPRSHLGPGSFAEPRAALSPTRM